MSSNNILEQAKQYILDNLQTNGTDKSLVVYSRRTGSEFTIAQQYSTYNGWFVYQGCELIVGDVTFDYAVQVLLEVTE